LFASSQTVYSQGLFDKLKEKIEQKIDEKENEAVDKTVDKTSDEIEKGVKKEGEKKENAEQKQTGKDSKEAANKQEDEKKATQDESLKVYSRYDFVPGEKVMFFEDFSQDVVGEFPQRWNTNGSGEIVTTNKYPGKWLKMKPGGTFYPEWEKLTLPENYTIEFDFVYNFTGDMNPPEFAFSLYKTKPDEAMDALVAGIAGVGIMLTPHSVEMNGWKDQNYDADNSSVETNILEQSIGKKIRVAMWVQKQRCRIYLNDQKIIDLPRKIHKGISYDRFRFNLWSINPENYDPMISNLRIAVGAPDTRNKLLTEGKLVTRGIKFDTGSDKIKPESYGVLKEIAGALSENPDVKVKIIGHTDTDGQAEKNLDLSKRRAASVKNALSGEFGINASRMETDGKGQTEPCDVNSTIEGKANNRRVEFIKTN
jgi:outer membrane protein OmpA-like peptidoglycan-associated protein